MKLKPLRTFVDQYDHVIRASTVKELAYRAGGGRISKMYVDKKNGEVAHVGYVVGNRWFTEFAPVEKNA